MQKNSEIVLESGHVGATKDLSDRYLLWESGTYFFFSVIFDICLALLVRCLVDVTMHEKLNFLMNICSIAVFLMESLIIFFDVCKFPLPLLDIWTGKYSWVELTFLNAYQI